MPRKKVVKVKTGVFNVSRTVESSRDQLVDVDGKKVIRKAKPLHMGDVDNNEIETPDNVLQEILEEFGRYFDPCPFVGRGNLPTWNGLEVKWGMLNFVNPPYNDVESWFAKAVHEWQTHGHISVFLVPVRAGTNYWRKWAYAYAASIRFINGKVIFKNYTTPPPHNLAFIVFGNRYPNAQIPTDTLHYNLSDWGSDIVNMKAFHRVAFREAIFTRTDNGRYLIHPASQRAAAWRLLCQFEMKNFLNMFQAEQLPPLLQYVLVPFYLACILLDIEQSRHYDFGATPDAEGNQNTLLEVLRCLRTVFQADRERLCQTVRQSIWAQPLTLDAETCQLVTDFHEAFQLHILHHQLNVLKLPYEKIATDPQFRYTTVY